MQKKKRKEKRNAPRNANVFIFTLMVMNTNNDQCVIFPICFTLSTPAEKNFTICSDTVMTVKSDFYLQTPRDARRDVTDFGILMRVSLALEYSLFFINGREHTEKQFRLSFKIA